MKLTERTRDAANQIARGVTLVEIPLPWGAVEWRASTMAIHGRALDGTPFTLTDVGAKQLLAWLRGVPIRLAFPQMDPSDRTLLSTGHIVDTYEDSTLTMSTFPAPGAVVLEYLDSYGWSQRDLAIRTGLTIKQVNAICSGTLVISPEIAALLEKALRRPAHLWINLQKNYDDH